MKDREMNRLRELTRKQITVYSVLASVIVAVLAAILYAGNYFHTYPAALVAVDSLCESKPDSANLMLRKLSSKDFGSKSDRMYYALLKIKVSNNLYEPQKDSTIFCVVDYFDKYGDKDKRREAYYYLGKYYIEHNDAPQALKCFHTSLDLSDDETPLKFKSKVYSQCGGLFFDQDLYGESVAMYRKSYSCDSLTNDTIGMIHGLRDMAQVYRNTNNYAKCEQLLVHSYELSKKINNADLLKSIRLVLSSLYINENRYKDAKSLLLECLPVEKTGLLTPIYAAFSKIYLKEQKMDSVLYFCNKLLQLENVYGKEYATRELVDIYFNNHDFAKVRYYLIRNRAYSDSIQKITATNSISKMHSLYNYQMREKENMALKEKYKDTVYFIVLSLLVLFLLIGALWIIIERSRRKVLMYKQLCEHLEILCTKSQDDINRLEKRVYELKGTVESKHVKEVLEERKCRKEKFHAYEIISDRMRCNKALSPGDWVVIENSFNIAFPQFKEKVYDLYSLKTNEFRVCMLVKLGFKNVDLSTILCRTAGTVSSTRRSLYRKLTDQKGNAKDFDDFIMSL